MNDGRRVIEDERRAGSYGQPAPPRSLMPRLLSTLTGLEPLLILLLAPFLIFPQVDRTPWLLAVIPLLWLCRWLAQGRLTARTPLDVPTLILLVMTAISLWATFDLTRSFPKFCGVFLGIALFYALANSIRTERGIWLTTGLILAGGVAVAGIGLVGTRWSAGKVPVLVPLLASLYQQLPPLLRGLPRAEEGFSSNQVGGTLILFIPLAATLILHRTTTRDRRQTQEDGHTAGQPQPGTCRAPSRIRRVVSVLGLAATLLLIVSVLLLTQSRLAYLSTVLALLLLCISLGRWPRLIASVLLCLGAGLLAYYGLERVGQAIFGIPNLEALVGDASWAARVEIWRRALRVIQDHPITGIGFDALYPVMHARYPTFLIAANRDMAHAHNLFLQVALDLGLPGLMAFVWLLAAFGWMLWQVWRSSESPAYRALAAGLSFGLLAQLIYGLADAIALGQKPGMFMWAYLGLGAALYTTVCSSPRPTFPIPRPTAHASRFVYRASRFAPLLITAFLLLSPIGLGYGRLVRARTWLSLIESDIATLQTLAWEGPQAIAPWQPEELLHTLRANLLGLQAEFALPLALAPYLGWVPGYGADLEAAPTLVHMGLRLTSAGEEILEPLQPFLSDTPTPPPTLSLEKEGGLGVAVTTLEAARPRLAQALTTLEEVRQIRQTIQTERLSARLGQWIARFDQTLLLLENSVRGALVLPDLLGVSEPRTYLILIQNEDELRPTGGFISGVARVVLEDAQVVELSFEDSYAVDDLSHPYPNAPSPLYEVMGAELWLFRDSNWSPDFPTSAQVAMALYWLGDDEANIDGILALDQHALQLLVTALEPLEVMEYPVPVTGENMVQAVRKSWAPSGEQGPTEEWWEHRKDFMGRLVTAAVQKLQDEPDQVNLASLGWTAFRSLEDRHALLYLPEAGPATDLLHQAGWDGAVVDTQGDYLMVVDANLGFNKVNPHITESLSYTIDLRDPALPQAKLAILHRHEGPATQAPCRHESRYDLTYEQMMQRCYWDYVRVYVPEGSHLLEATPHPIPGSLLLRGESLDGQAQVLPAELGKSVFATFLVLAPGEWTESEFAYDLPQEAVARNGHTWHYRLYIQKQAGTEGNEVLVTLRLPAAAEIAATSPPPTRHEGDTLSYELQLQSDINLLVDWKGRSQ